MSLLPGAPLAESAGTRNVNRTDSTCQGQTPCSSTIQAAVDAAQPRPRDRQPPVLTLIEPPEGAIVTTPTVTVRGTVTEESAVTVRKMVPDTISGVTAWFA